MRIIKTSELKPGMRFRFSERSYVDTVASIEVVGDTYYVYGVNNINNPFTSGSVQVPGNYPVWIE